MSDVMERFLARLLLLSANGSHAARIQPSFPHSLNILNGCRAS
jgi:hypothetical protein